MCVWYQVVRVCNPCGACVFWSTDHHEALRTKNGFGREKRPMEGRNRGLHRRPRGQNPCSFGGVAGTNLNAHTNQDIPTHKGRKNYYFKIYSSCRCDERQLIHVTVVRRVRPRAERRCDCEGHRRCKRAGRTLFCN